MEDGSYYRLETGQVVYDHYNNKYVKNNVSNGIVLGIINNKLEEGYFQKNISCVKVRLREKTIYGLNSEILKFQTVRFMIYL